MAAVDELNEFLCSVPDGDKEGLWKREFIESGTGRTLTEEVAWSPEWHGAMTYMEGRRRQWEQQVQPS